MDKGLRPELAAWSSCRTQLSPERGGLRMLLTCPSDGRSRDVQWTFLQECPWNWGWAQCPGKGWARMCGYSYLAKGMDREKKTQNLADPLHVPRAHLHSPSQSWPQSQEKMNKWVSGCRPENLYYINIFFLSNRCALWLPPGSGGDTGGCWGLPVTIMESKVTKAAVSSPSSPHPHPLQLHCWQHCCRWQYWDLIDLEPHHPPHCPMWLVPRNTGTWKQWRRPTSQGTQATFFTTLQI